MSKKYQPILHVGMIEQVYWYQTFFWIETPNVILDIVRRTFKMLKIIPYRWRLILNEVRCIQIVAHNTKRLYEYVHNNWAWIGVEFMFSNSHFLFSQNYHTPNSLALSPPTQGHLYNYSIRTNIGQMHFTAYVFFRFFFSLVFMM